MTTSSKLDPLEIKVLQQVVEKYFEGTQFNGFPLHHVRLADKGLVPEYKEIVARLLKKNRVDLNFGDQHPNIHIKAFNFGPRDQQLEKMKTTEDFCVYPSKEHLRKTVKKERYSGRPFSFLMALGEPQLAFFPFDLKVLENYRNDPRYIFETNDFGGSLSISGKFYRSSRVRASDKVMVEYFGFAYDKKLNKYVGPYLWNLSRLSPRHQQLWMTFKSNAKTFLHPVYEARSSGRDDFGISICDAILREKGYINDLANLIEGKSLFRTLYEEGKRPRFFSLLIKPTRREYDSFIGLLDKLLSDDLNKRFFPNLAETIEEERNGKIYVTRKGTIQLLEEWAYAFAKNPKARAYLKKNLFDALRSVRKQRNPDSHGVHDDEFDQKYIRMQRDVLQKTFRALRALRSLMMSMPRGREFKLPDYYTLDKVYNW